jgi:UDP-N-acetylmuramate dehydrogenase
MSIEQVIEATSVLPGVQVRASERMARHTPLRIGGATDIWMVVDDLETMKKVLGVVRSARLPWRLHWPFEDWLVQDEGLDGVTIRPGKGFEWCSRTEHHVRLGPACPWAALSGLGDGWWSSLAHWPGTPGGLFASGEEVWIAGICARVKWLKGRSIYEVVVQPGESPPSIPVGAILLEVELRPGLQTVREGRYHPPHSGTLFRDPPGPSLDRSAGVALEHSGLLGTRLKSWRLSQVEPGTVIHTEEGSSRELLMLLNGIRERVKKTRGAPLETRLPVLGRRRRPQGQ